MRRVRAKQDRCYTVGSARVRMLTGKRPSKRTVAALRDVIAAAERFLAERER